MLLQPFNVLVMDEPTNHLDMASKNVLKEALKNFEGTLILVSHDRDFLQGLTNMVYEFRDHRIKPYVLAERSQIKLPVPMAPKVGAFRPTNRGKNIKADRIYYMIFGNPDAYVKAGEKVSVVIGDFRAEHLTVQ